VWGVSSLRPNQTAVLCHVGNPLKLRKVLLVKCTCGVKVAGVTEKGITYILQNFHSLLAD
jgi:hypothetical protein